jgi:hypothetical protein
MRSNLSGPARSGTPESSVQPGLLIGGDGIAIEDSLMQPVEHWIP